MKLEKITDFLNKNKYAVLIWILSTSFFLYQHSTGVSWDFSTYVLNARYLFGKGSYFNPHTGPLVPLVISLFSFFGWKAAEYIFIVFTSGLFAFSSFRMAKKFGIHPNLFYALLTTPFLLNYGFFAGTELFTLSLLMLFIAHLKDKGGGVFGGLAGLVRYTSFLYLPLLFLQKNWKKILLSIGLVFLLFVPWFLFNWYSTGSPIHSMVSSYALNIGFRDYVHMPPKLSHFFYSVGYYLPFLFLGVWIRWRDGFERRDWVIAVFGLLTVFSYVRTPIKLPRYLFNLALPVAYFAYPLFKRFRKVAVPLVIVLNLSFAAIFFAPLPSYPGLEEGVEEMDRCMVASNQWIHVNYFGRAAEPVTTRPEFRRAIDEGKRVFLYKHGKSYTLLNSSFLSNFPKIEETENYIVLGNRSKCHEIRKVDSSYIQRLKEKGIDKEGCKEYASDFFCEYFY